jgi:SAM-dependent methyltransferase
MQKTELNITENIIVPGGVNTDGRFRGFNLNRPVCIEFEPLGSYRFINLVDYFQEYNRLQCIYGKQTETGLEFFERKKPDIAAEKPITVENIWRILRGGFYQFCSEFNPIWMISVVKFLQKFMKIERVLDMSAGRGARLIAAVSMGVDYVGVDPCRAVFEKYETMGLFYRDVFGTKSSFNFINKPFEEAEIEGPFDLMFSSPPYFDLEKFSNEETQSVKKFSNLEIWLEKFLRPCMQKILGLLRPGGLMCINIDNPLNRSIDYVNSMLGFKFENAQYLGPIQIRRGGMYYNVWCWQLKDYNL